ncbi:MAG TPA: zinc-dependent alcohol dehydrogenase [Kofleriaceae bacterium]
MKAVVWHGIGDIRLDDVPEPRIEKPTDAIVRLTASAICGTDLHMIHGTLAPMKVGTILGHEGVGVIEELGADVRNFNVGDRVLIPSTIACGNCAYCRAGCYSQCDFANPNGKRAGTAFFGGPVTSGSFPGLQAEKARIPFAHVGLIKLPDDVSDEQAILLSDIFPTGYFGAMLAEITPGDTVCVFGCGPVGLFTVLSAKLMDAGRVFAIDCEPSRLAKARELGAEVINFEEEDPIETLLRLTEGIGVDRAIDAVGVDALRPHRGPAAAKVPVDELERERHELAPDARLDAQQWIPGDGPSLALTWAVDGVCKNGTVAVIGVYPETAHTFPIGKAMNKNLTLKLGNCDHRKIIPIVLDLVRTGVVDPTQVLSHVEPISAALDAYRHFDHRDAGWIKVELQPQPITS